MMEKMNEQSQKEKCAQNNEIDDLCAALSHKHPCFE
jgi:hypothetical protein